jgi:hypothetical protein
MRCFLQNQNYFERERQTDRQQAGSISKDTFHPTSWTRFQSLRPTWGVYVYVCVCVCVCVCVYTNVLECMYVFVCLFFFFFFLLKTEFVYVVLAVLKLAL